MKVKCKVLRGFNKHKPGDQIVAPSRGIFESWKAYGFVEEVKEASPSRDRMVRETMDK